MNVSARAILAARRSPGACVCLNLKAMWVYRAMQCYVSLLLASVLNVLKVPHHEEVGENVVQAWRRVCMHNMTWKKCA